MADGQDQAARATRLAALDAQEDYRKIPAGAISPTHVTEDDIYIQFNARFRPVAASPEDELPADEVEENVQNEAVAVSEE